MDQGQSQGLFLEEDATSERRWQALSRNVQAYYERLARADGEEAVREDGLLWTREHLTISVVDPCKINGQIDRALQWYRDRQPPGGAICWYLAGEAPGDLGARLFARGFSPNWQPHWMWCELGSLQRDRFPPAPCEMQIVEDEPAWQVEDLPNYDPKESASLAALARIRPRHVWHLAAFQGQQVVGHCVLNVTTGEWGVGGLFNMGVIPEVRRQGIGTALAQATCELAQQLGCHHVVLNATAMGGPVYRRVGFVSMGFGYSWYLRAQTCKVPAPSQDLVAFLEAVGRGDLTTLDETSRRLEEKVFHELSPGDLTPLDIAVRCQQPASAQWLVEHGVRLDLLSAWDLGWKERLPALLAAHPELVNLQRGEWHLTPLHVAVDRNDSELVKLLLTVPNDLTLKDTEFQSTALGWARYFERQEIAELIKQHCARYKKRHA